MLSADRITRRKFLTDTVAAAGAATFCAPLLSGCTGTERGAGTADGAKRLNVFSWADYLHPNAISDFEKKYGIQVTYDTFASNETLLARLEAGPVDYDIVVPSNYVITKMLKLKLLQRIDHERIPNYKYVMDRFRRLAYDPGNRFSIPYTFGSTGIAFNKEAYEAVGSTGPVDWDAFWDTRFAHRITLLEDARETLGCALKRRGFSFNSVVPKELYIARDDLIQQKPLVMAYTSDQVIQSLASGDALLSICFSGDALQARRENPSVRYIIPKSGSAMWFDNMCIPAQAPHVEAAYLWMNYILDPDVSSQLTNHTYYPTPNTGARSKVNPELLADKTIYMTEDVMDICEEFADIGDGIFLYDRCWTELKCV